MIRRFALALVAGTALATGATLSHGNTLFTDQAVPSTGSFEWDVFTGAYTTVRTPDATSTGAGAATLTAGSFPNQTMPPSLFPAPQTFGNQLYTGGFFGRFTTNLASAETTAPQTTLVLQLAYDASGNVNPSTLALNSVLVNGAPATEFVDRGASGGLQYYWMQWQLAAESSYAITFDSDAAHFALDGVQLDYFNGSTVFDAVAAGAVPEPTAALLAALGLIPVAARRRRK